ITEMRKRKFAYQIGMDVSTDGKGTLADSYFKEYSDNRSYEDVFEAAFNAKYLVELIRAVWGAESPYKLLDCGSANGLTLEQFDKLGVEAWGIENMRTYIRKRQRSGLNGTCLAMCLECRSRKDRSTFFT